jgi:predicted RNA binding protein with dsRBD fold (UPF0201 family)
LDDVSVEVEALVYPTEDREKVLAAVNNVVTLGETSELEVRSGIHIIRGRGFGKDCLLRLQNLIRQDRIRDAVRAILYSAIRASGLTFYLNKQVALVNHVSFCGVEGESPLGPITVRVKCSNPTMFIDWLAPTTQGRVKE